MTKPTLSGGAAGPIRANALDGLVGWFERQRRILPWREDPAPYRVWISEIMLQQTQVATVLPYFDRFLAVFPTVETLAHADEAEVMKAWAGLGYYSRARNLHRAAKRIAAEGFPETKTGWEELPGIGPYTAGAITSIAYGLPEPIVDGNVERVFARLRRLRRSEGERPYRETLWELSREAVESAHARGISPSRLNQGWMELGALVCTPRSPSCLLCPIRGDCAAFAAGEVGLFPEKKKRPEFVEMSEERIARVDLAAERIYVEQAPEGAWRAGLWDLPEAKGRTAGSEETLITKHVVTHHKITRRMLIVFADSRKTKGETKGAGRWISMRDPEVAVGSALKKGIGAIRERFL